MSYGLNSVEDISSGEVTDAYFDRTMEALEGSGTNPDVVAEITESQRNTGVWRVIGGVNDAIELLDNCEDITVESLPEGTAFDGGPVMRIKGPYQQFAKYETALLGLLSQASGYATAAAEVRQKHPDAQLLSFGGRHIHPGMGNVLERTAYVAGFDGFSLKSAEDMIGEKASGTMPHALILSFGRNNQEQAWEAFDEHVPDNIPRIALIDTFSDEVDEARRAVETLGEKLTGLRLDTTSSRRGDFQQIIREVKWELDELGRSDVEIYVSGGMTPESISELNELVDGFGVGSYISDGRPLDFGMDIVQIDGENISKRGKYGGPKEVLREDGNHVITRKTTDKKYSFLETVIDNGNVTQTFDIHVSRERCLAELQEISGSVLRK